MNTGSTGRIASEIGDILINQGHSSVIAYGRSGRECSSTSFKIGGRKDFIFHLVCTRVFDRHGFGLKAATFKLAKYIQEIDPDIIHLHNIHGYYIHVGVLFNFLKAIKKPVVWTFHDCWPFTGHCSYFDRVDCYKWESECFDCPMIKYYPKSWFVDNSRNNFRIKKSLFSGIAKMTLVSPSVWLANHLRNSFLQSYNIEVINNGVDIDRFSPAHLERFNDKYRFDSRYIILGVASIWDQRKGLSDFVKLRSLIDPDIGIVLVGLNMNQIRNLPLGIYGISRTESIEELALIYSAADIFVNPTHVDNFPTTNLEALACGTPVVTYDTGGSPEQITRDCGIIVKKGDISGLRDAIIHIINAGKDSYSVKCRSRAEEFYNKNETSKEYLKIYERLINN
jgi:glycosyltransferase involved in cell wall biosynthesis